MTRTAVIGGGIKGAALAALLAVDDQISVTLIERATPSAGATSTNHGRLHAGTSGWRNDAPELIRRRLAGAKAMWALDGVCEAPKRAVYCIPDAEVADRFAGTCRDNGIQIEDAGRLEIPTGWILDRSIAAAFLVPEYGFDPAATSGRLAAECERRGGTLLLGRKAVRVSRREAALRLNFETGPPLDADIVVNAASRWSTTIDPPLPGLEVTWHAWRVLCARADNLPELHQVVVVVDERRGDPTVIPHGRWVSLDCKVPFVEHDSPEDLPRMGWRRARRQNRPDGLLLEALEYWFAPVRAAREHDAVFSFAGVHGRQVDAAPGSMSTVEEHPDLRGYWVTFGGQASTALLDALDVARRIIGDERAQSAMKRLAAHVERGPHPATTPMIWAQHDQIDTHV